ncbi:MAG: lytic transglycosylase domain-containing protein [Spirochaetia bacterium]|jgi:hypothetical protein|nr:lytic transglycosylase domain-containing protein [Spirochaetia bacterium]
MRPFAIGLILLLALLMPACVGGSIQGLDEAAWFELLVSDKELPLSSETIVDFDSIARLGPGAYLFLAMRADDDGQDELSRILLGEAVKREKGPYHDRAVELLCEALLYRKEGKALVKICQSDDGASLAPYKRAYLETQGLMLQKLYVQAAATIDAIRAAHPEEAAKDAPELSAMAIESGFKAGRGRWANEFASVVAMDGSPRVYAALAIIVRLIEESSLSEATAAIQAIGPRTFRLAEARALMGTRDYGPSVVAFRRFAAAAESPADIAAGISKATIMALPIAEPPESPDTVPLSDDMPTEPLKAETSDSLASSGPDAGMAQLSAKAAANLFLTLPRAAASDAAKAFLAISRDEGAAGFNYIVTSTLDRGADPSREYFNAYWQARYLRAANRWAEAETWFAKAASLADGDADRDAAAWYEAEAAWKRSTKAAIAALGRALSTTRNPGYYSDLIEPISREALVARDGLLLASLDTAVLAKASARDAARLSYLFARAAQSSIIRDAHVSAQFDSAAAYADARLASAYEQSADSWYRLAAAYRLGKPLVEPLLVEDEPARVTQAIDTKSGSPSKDPAVDSVVGPTEYALAMAKFGLGARVRSELGAAFYELDKPTLRSIAETLRSSGRHDQAYRLIATLFWKTGFVPTRQDATLYWPRPFRESFDVALKSTGIDEFLLWGLIRSESGFDPQVVSKSGAVGLTQLMPATAEEMAGRLKLESYSLTDPSDNMSIGSAYFARLLANLDGRVLPAVFSYNGGPTRFKRWEAEYGSLPMDLLLESLSYAETRQYGRNVAHAALSYAALYGDKDLREYFAYLLGEGPRP